MHQYQGLAFFDYACAGPYVEIDMKNGSEDPMDWIDASFHSPHKFPGGPQAVGILLARRSLLAHGPLAVVGGGVVRWVDAQDHAYVQDAEQRHEAGTPAIVGSIRAGMAFYIKSLLSHQGQLAHRLQQLAMTGLQRLASMPDVIVLGPSAVYEHINSPLEEAWLGGPPRGWKLPVFSVQFRVLHPAARGRLLHHHLASRLLSDVFGIQARSGCACAGPYFQELTNMSVSQVREMVGMVEMGHEAAKMGFLRFRQVSTLVFLFLFLFFFFRREHPPILEALLTFFFPFSPCIFILY
jgi:selenocysteine lyase/cysteine desulfurase